MSGSDCNRTSSILQAIAYGTILCALALLAPPLWTTAKGFVAAKLQDRFPHTPCLASESITGIIVLGGSHARVLEGFRLARKYATAKLLLTGASSQDEAYAEKQNLPNGRLLIDPYAKTTFQNAIFSRRLLRPTRFEKWLIVTSAFHMPRAAGTFRQAGFFIVPWSVFDHSDAAAIPTRRLLHEIIVLLA
jgi:uncharacterized SAM-binding protein YcdF (DUF218 family)